MNNPPSSPTSEQTIFPSWFARSPLARALSLAYGAILSCRNALYDYLPFLSRTAPRPVISIGGIRMGGTGKTPVALFVAKYLLSRKYAVAFLSRGYGRNDAELRIVRPMETVPWEQIGDEPWLLHNQLPGSWLGIHANRLKSAVKLAPLLPEQAVFVLDDGFQHRALKRNLDIVCLHESPQEDNLAPAGNLREGASALARAQIALLIGNFENRMLLENHCIDLLQRFPHLKAFAVTQKAGLWVNADDGRTAEAPPLEKPLLVCGIARPERFVEMVRHAGIIPGDSIIFPDHHRYITNDFNKTRELYSNGVITTEKDAVRLKKIGVVPAGTLWYLNMELCFRNEAQEIEFNLLINKHIS